MNFLKFLGTITMMCFITISLTACSDDRGAQKALAGAGYTDIKTDGYTFWGCGKDDTYHTKFTAKGPTGVTVTGTVCGGVFKGSTIRTD